MTVATRQRLCRRGGRCTGVPGRCVEHGGHIYATDNPGGGTRMHFTLPRSTAQGPVLDSPGLTA